MFVVVGIYGYEMCCLVQTKQFERSIPRDPYSLGASLT
jgi:hypothetical protein